MGVRRPFRVPTNCAECLGSILTGLDDARVAADLAALPCINPLGGNLAATRPPESTEESAERVDPLVPP